MNLLFNQPDTRTTPGLILGIETSCDETGIALYDTKRGLLSHVVHSQIKLHEEYGGVVPELASRDHIARVLPLIQQVVSKANVALIDINAIAYTAGPGLGGALLVGAAIASALAFSLNIPAIPVHHMEAHLLAPMLEHESPLMPFVALLVSGGHTQLMEVIRIGDYRLLGESLDDAAGEALDKIAQLLGLGYPGGPAIEKLATLGTPDKIKLPRPMLNSGDLNFSFSGLKTAVLTLLQNKERQVRSLNAADIALAVQSAVIDVLIGKALQALEETGLRHMVVAGGVGANQALRGELSRVSAEKNVKVYYARPEFCTDNGAMIALAGALHPIHLDDYAFNIHPRWTLGSDA